MKKIIIIVLSFLILIVATTTVYYVTKTKGIEDNNNNLVAQNNNQDETVENDDNNNAGLEDEDQNIGIEDNNTQIDDNNEIDSNNDLSDGNSEQNSQEENHNDNISEDGVDIEYYNATIEELQEYRVNENGTIFVLMFHGFITEDMKETYNDREYSMTLNQFKETLEILYDLDYRPISMNDMITGNIDVPLGKIPIVLTFDDGRSGQFSFVEKDGENVINKDTAVYVWQEFTKENPDFKMRGTFYVNLGLETFGQVGTLKDRLTYMIDQGFEIGNHTYSHDYLKQMTTPEEVIYEIGKNQKVMSEIIDGYKFTSLALPFGEDVSLESLQKYVVSGEYEGVGYQNLGVLDCKWRSSPSIYDVDFNERLIYRVRADGLEPVECDLSYWLDATDSKRGQYISDGNPNVVTVPYMVEGSFSREKAEKLGKEIKMYELE